MKSKVYFNFSILILTILLILQLFSLDIFARGGEMKLSEEDQTINIEVTKDWKDGSNAENSRPGKIAVDLKSGDKTVKTIEITPDDEGHWTGEFKDVPRFDDEGNEIQYVIEEQPIDGYMSSVSQGEIVSDYVYPDNVYIGEIDTETRTTDPVTVHGGNNWFIQQGLRTDYIEGTQVVFNNSNLAVSKAKLTEYDANGNLVDDRERVIRKTTDNGTNQGDNSSGNAISFKPIGSYPNSTVVDTDHYFVLEFPNAVTVLDGTDTGSQRSVRIKVDNISVYKTKNASYHRLMYGGLWAGPGDSSHGFGGQSMDLTFSIDGVTSGNVLLSFTDVDVTSDSHETGASRRESVYLVDGFDNTIYTLPLAANNTNETRVTYTYFAEQNGAMRAYSRGQDSASTLQSGFVTRAVISEQGFKLRWTGTGCATLLFSQIKPFKLKVTVDENTVAHAGGTVTEQGPWRYRNYGEAKVISITPDENHHIKYLKIDGKEIALDGFDENGYMEIADTGYSEGNQTLNPGTVNKGKETVKLYQREKGVVDVYLPAQYFAVNNTAPDRVDHWIDTGFESNGLARNYTITNELMTSIDGTKTWISGNTTHVDNSSLNFTLKRRLTSQEPGTETEYPFDKSSQMTWDGDHYVITGLPAYDKDGEKYVYTITETPPAGYDVTQDGNDLINTLKQQYITVQGKKTWKDGGKSHNNAEEVIIHLYRAEWNKEFNRYGSASEQDAVPVWTGDTYKFENLPKYDEDRYEYRYTVTESVSDAINTDPAKGDYYECVPDSTGRNFVNTLKGTTTFSGTKTWLDGNKTHDNTDPQEITTVLFNESETETKSQRINTLNGSRRIPEWDGNTFTYKDLPKYDSEGYPYTYSVRESVVMGKNSNVADYDVYYDGELWDFNSYDTPAQAYNVTGKEIINALRGSVTVNKIWNDDNDRDGKRPSAVTIHLMNGDKEAGSAEIKGDEWTYTFTDIPLYKADGELINYSITEDPVKDTDGNTIYTPEVGKFEWNKDKTGLTVDVTNTHEIEKTKVKVTKVWDDADDADRLRPDTVTLDLLADGTKIDSVTLPKDGNWSYEFKDLPVNDGGKKVKYTAEEAETNIPEGYKPSYSTDRLTVTNTHVRYTKTSLSGVKTLTGREMTEGEFEFMLEAADDATEKAVADGKVILPKGNAKSPASADGVAGEFSFGDIVFKDAGKYKFKVSEVTPASNPSDGVTFDTSVRTVEIEVTEKDNALKVDKTIVDGDEGISFRNSYSASGAYTPEGEKTLTGQSETEADEQKPVDEKTEKTMKSEAAASGSDSNTSDDTTEPAENGNDNNEVDQASVTEENVSVDEEKTETSEQDDEVFSKANSDGSDASLETDAAEDSMPASEISTENSEEETAPAEDYSASEENEVPAQENINDTAPAEENINDTADAEQTVSTGSEAKSSKAESGTGTEKSNGNGDAADSVKEKQQKGEAIGMSMTEGQFRFEIRYTNGDQYKDKVASSGENMAAGADEKAAIDFETMSYNTALLVKLMEDGAATRDDDGKYHISYYVVETKPDADCYQHNTSVESFEAVITDDGKGKLSVTAEPSTVISFTNRYITDTATVSLDGLKILNTENGSRTLKEGDFEFTVECLNGAPAPERITTSNDAGGAVSFGEIEFTKGDIGDAVSKTFTYIISETKGSIHGMTYDKEDRTVTVTVSDDGQGHLKATTDPESTPLFTFTNNYKPDPVSETVNKDITINKVLKGMDLKDGQFSFRIEPANDDTRAAVEAGEVRMPSTDTVKNKADGSVTFDKITYSKTGTYSFTIQEAIPEGAVKTDGVYEYDGIKYDSIQYVAVVIVADDENGKLFIESQKLTDGGSKAEFINSKIPEVVPEEENEQDEPDEPDEPDKEEPETIEKSGRAKTGDDSGFAGWLALMLAAGAGTGGTVAYRRRRGK